MRSGQKRPPLHKRHGKSLFYRSGRQCPLLESIYRCAPSAVNGSKKISRSRTTSPFLSPRSSPFTTLDLDVPATIAACHTGRRRRIRAPQGRIRRSRWSGSGRSRLGRSRSWRCRRPAPDPCSPPLRRPGAHSAALHVPWPHPRAPLHRIPPSAPTLHRPAACSSASHVP